MGALFGNPVAPGPAAGLPVSSGQAELAEVRSYPRTFETNAAAFYWQSGRSNWNNVIDQKIFEYRLDLNPPRAALVYALAYVAAYDATVACWDAKYTYWTIPPFLLGVTPLFTTPNHPSYPPAHGSFSGSVSAVLAYLFPHDAVDLNALGTEAGESRLWAGIHFRSDIDTGLLSAGRLPSSQSSGPRMMARDDRRPKRICRQTQEALRSD